VDLEVKAGMAGAGAVLNLRYDYVAWVQRAAAIRAASSSWAWAALVAAAVGGTIALIGIAANLAAARRDRRAGLYAEAYKAALAMVEMVYRARRASDNARSVIDRYRPAPNG
jgi:hypothetical protein